MAATHEKLRKLLTGLEADTPWLQKAYPDRSDFVHAFAEQAGLIADIVDAENDAWVSAEINRILGRAH